MAQTWLTVSDRLIWSNLYTKPIHLPEWLLVPCWVTGHEQVQELCGWPKKMCSLNVTHSITFTVPRMNGRSFSSTLFCLCWLVNCILIGFNRHIKQSVLALNRLRNVASCGRGFFGNKNKWTNTKFQLSTVNSVIRITPKQNGLMSTDQ